MWRRSFLVAAVAILAVSASPLAFGAPALPTAPPAFYQTQTQCPSDPSPQTLFPNCGNVVAGGTNPAPYGIQPCPSPSSATDNAIIGAGVDNTIQSSDAGIWVGTLNAITCPAQRAYVGAGNSNTVTAPDSVVVAGRDNMATHVGAIVVAGVDNKAFERDAAILAGTNNHAFARQAFIGAGTDNYVNQDNSYIGGGYNNSITGLNPGNTNAETCGNLMPDYQDPTPGSLTGGELWHPCASFIGAGYKNHIEATGSAIGGGVLNTIFKDARFSLIGGGESQSVKGPYDAILSGLKNSIGAPTFASAIAGGNSNRILAGTDAFLGGGKNNVIVNSYSSILGGERNQVVAPFGFIGAGTGNFLGGPAFASVIGGGVGNLVNSAVGMVGGGQGNQVRNTAAFVGGGVRNTVIAPQGIIGGGQANWVGAENAIIVGGQANTNQGAEDGIIGGQLNRASADNVFVGGGYMNNGQSIGAMVGGGAQNDAQAMDTTIPGGCQAIADVYGQFTQAACGFSRTDGDPMQIPGTAQRSLFVLRGQVASSSGVASTELFTDGTGAQMRLRPETTWTYQINCNALDTQSGATQSWLLKGVVARRGATIAIVGIPVVTILNPSTAAASWNCQAGTDPTTLALTVTGTANGNVRFDAGVRTVEVSFGGDLPPADT